MSLDQMRQSYTQLQLHESDLLADPVEQFQAWFREALAAERPSWFEVNAMTLSTSDRQGAVTSRIVLLKGVEDGQLLFFTNYDSAKGQQLADNPQVSLCFFWPHLQRQVRVEGTTGRTTRQQSEAYFASRPRGSQLGAVVSRQSQPIADRQTLEHAFAQAQLRYADQAAIACPDNWGGYVVTPQRMEFWQGRESRVHDRLLYCRDDSGQWRLSRLSP